MIHRREKKDSGSTHLLFKPTAITDYCFPVQKKDTWRDSFMWSLFQYVMFSCGFTIFTPHNEINRNSIFQKLFPIPAPIPYIFSSVRIQRCRIFFLCSTVPHVSNFSAVLCIAVLRRITDPEYFFLLNLRWYLFLDANFAKVLKPKLFNRTHLSHALPSVHETRGTNNQTSLLQLTYVFGRSNTSLTDLAYWPRLPPMLEPEIRDELYSYFTVILTGLDGHFGVTT